MKSNQHGHHGWPNPLQPTRRIDVRTLASGCSSVRMQCEPEHRSRWNTDTSTSDTSVLMANGARSRWIGGLRGGAGGSPCTRIPRSWPRDGEGAPSCSHENWDHGDGAALRRRMPDRGRSLVEFPVIKTNGVRGQTPTWGGSLMAWGSASSSTLAPERLDATNQGGAGVAGGARALFDTDEAVAGPCSMCIRGTSESLMGVGERRARWLGVRTSLRGTSRSHAA